MRTDRAESVIAAAARILRDHASGIVVPSESLDWAVLIALANAPSQSIQSALPLAQEAM